MLASICISGGECLHGDIRVQGSKNAALPILAASILARGTTRLYHCPQILDVFNMLKILENMGCHTELEKDCVVVDTWDAGCGQISEEDAAAMRSSVMLMGAMLGRMKEIRLPWPGGCSIGKRPVNLHLDALEKMNVTVDIDENGIYARTCKLTGSEIFFPYPSVGATENVILAAVLADGTTVIHQAAKEPEIIDLCLFLNEMGADIHGMGTGHIIIHGVSHLNSVDYTVMSDRIVAGTYLAAAAATCGDVSVYGVCEKDMHSTLQALAQTGCGIVICRNKIRVLAPQILLPIESIHTQPFPGFPTDMQSQLMAVVTKAHGTSVIYEDIFENRFKTAGWLEKMGADVCIDQNRTVVRGVSRLYGSKVWAEDLRGGAALVIAGLMAEGDTVVEDPIYIERGYQDICGDLASLGARIRRR